MVVVAVVFVQEGQRRIPMQYARRQLGSRQTTGGSTYMPLRVNMAGVIPVIFAAALLALPQTDRPASSRRGRRWVNANFVPTSWYVPRRGGGADHRLHVLLHVGPVQPGRPGGQPAQVRRLHPGHPAGPADGGVSRPRAAAPDAARLALPRHRRGRSEHLHPLLRVLAGDVARTRRHLGADRRRCRARHDAPDGVPDDDASLRRASSSGREHPRSRARRAPARARRPRGSRRRTASRTSPPAT